MMKTPNLNRDYWETRYQERETQWDLGQSSTALLDLIQLYVKPEARILFPGAGYAHDAAELIRRGYTDVHICDWAESAVAQIVKEDIIPTEQVHVQDFFTLEGHYDAIAEMTFFCAIDPQRRPDYVDQVHKLLNPGGYLLGLFWNCTFESEGPPWGGSLSEYRGLFQDQFELIKESTAEKSVKPRMGRELELVFQKKS